MELEEEMAALDWYPYESGATIGEMGPARGFVLRDEELGDPDDEESADARLTLEQGGVDRPGFFLTATLYGWMFHTHRLDTESEATGQYALFKDELENLSEMLPYEEDRNVHEKVRLLTETVAQFERRFP